MWAPLIGTHMCELACPFGYCSSLCLAAFTCCLFLDYGTLSVYVAIVFVYGMLYDYCVCCRFDQSSSWNVGNGSFPTQSIH